MSELVVIDTDVLIDYLRDRAEAVTYVEALTEPVLMSVITLAELFAGVREGSERANLEALVSVFELVNIDSKIARLAGIFQRSFRKSHKIELPDALIAATAQTRKARLVTLNAKHFPMIGDLIVPYRKSS